MTIVVTGATGNVGRPLVTQLVNAGAKVRAVSRNLQSAGFAADVDVVESAAAAIPEHQRSS
ncbi:short chain dehydrogenase family protein [Mycobacterium xenopi 4042]|uniref:Short chain dehydrogenase family protein n=1 Tax=Mycobacterium xenopi 4042 TaxID=1299334 RepID=X8AG45_MYCXE|nr:short chain dehydrogenase family protein [Mycobacterium xenopi 4042]